MDKQLKTINANLKALEEQDLTIDHCISDDLPDRTEDTINQDGWVLENYLNNPVVLENHDYSLPAVGKCIKLYRKDNQLRAITQFAPTEKGKMYYELYKNDYQRAFSVGFNPIEYKPNKNGGYDYAKQELLEYSVVTVPCNPRATKILKVEEDNMDIEKLKELVATVKECLAAIEELVGPAEKVEEPEQEDPKDPEVIEEEPTVEPEQEPAEEPKESVEKPESEEPVEPAEEPAKEEVVVEDEEDEEIPEEEVKKILEQLVDSKLKSILG